MARVAHTSSASRSTTPWFPLVCSSLSQARFPGFLVLVATLLCTPPQMGAQSREQSGDDKQSGRAPVLAARSRARRRRLDVRVRRNRGRARRRIRRTRESRIRALRATANRSNRLLGVVRHLGVHRPRDRVSNRAILLSIGRRLARCGAPTPSRGFTGTTGRACSCRASRIHIRTTRSGRGSGSASGSTSAFRFRIRLFTGTRQYVYGDGMIYAAPTDISLYGGVAFTITPDDASVAVDGVYVGIARDFSSRQQPLTLTPGRHHIELQAPDRVPLAFDVDIRPGEVLPFHGTLQSV